MRRRNKSEKNVLREWLIIIVYCIITSLYGILPPHTYFSRILVISSVIAIIQVILIIYKETHAKNTKNIEIQYWLVCIILTCLWLFIMCENSYSYGFLWYGCIYDTVPYLLILIFIRWRANFFSQSLNIYKNIKGGVE